MVNIWSIISQLIGEHCPLCGEPGGSLCLSCGADLPRNHHACTHCALPLPPGVDEGMSCADCQSRPPGFDRATAPLVYGHPVDDLIAGFKYHHRLPLGRDLADLLASTLDRRRPLPELLLPIPMHRQGLRERGFNQASELARQLSVRLGIPWSAAYLTRRHDGDRQRGLRRRKRLGNTKGRFSCRSGLPSHVALIDDVITTGATVDEASRVARRAGAATIEVWAVARTPRERRDGR